MFLASQIFGLELGLGLVLAGPSQAAAPCPVDIVAERVEALSPVLGRPRASFGEGVLELEFVNADDRPVALLAVHLAEGRMSTSSTAPRLGPEAREVLNALGPQLAADQATLRALASCPTGTATAGERASAWETNFNTEPSADGASSPPQALPNPATSSESESRPATTSRSGPGLTLAIACGAILLALLGIFGLRRNRASKTTTK